MAETRVKVKSHLSWTWILMVIFFALSIIKMEFAILAVICMLSPIYHSARGKGKINCSHYCPRGSFLGKFLDKISLNNPIPKFMKTNYFKISLFFFMMGMFTVSMIKANGDLYKMGFGIFRLIIASTIIAVLMGIFTKPRAWCQVCPMGYASGVIRDVKNKK